MNCIPSSVQTNMVFLTLDDATITEKLVRHLADANIAVLGGNVMRLVTHMDISRSDVDRMVDVCEKFLKS